ncbi:hypothetical protein ACVW0B_001944 [Thermostichus sp. MS-CIW-23]|jgi:hypothetical protein
MAAKRLLAETVYGFGNGIRFCTIKSMTLVNDTLDYTENNVQYVQYGCLVWLGM